MYSMVAVFKSGRGKKYVDYGIRRLRRELLGLEISIIVYADEWYGIFDLKEFLSLLGKPPSGALDDVRIRLAPG